MTTSIINSARVIYQYTGNTVYGMPYSDRFVHAPALVNSVQFNLDGTDHWVDAWVVDIGIPSNTFLAIPEPSAISMVLLSLALIQLMKRRRPQRL